MRSALIGISTTLAMASWDNWNKSASLLPVDYVDKIHDAGGVPLLIPPLPRGADKVIAGVDALVLSSGEDIDPAHYGQRPHPLTRPGLAIRDTWELALAAAAVRADIPVLGICRGLQVLNVAFGGTLIQHLPDVIGHELHLPDRGGFGSHRVTLAPDSSIVSVFGHGMELATHHHQAVRTCGRGFRAIGWADDGTIEAIEMPGKKFVVGLQGHPEIGQDTRLFEHFVRMVCSERQGGLADQEALVRSSQPPSTGRTVP